MFSWKTPGRRLEDVDTSRKIAWKTRIQKKNINYILYYLSGLCLPGPFARGVHVFQASSRRLPGKHNGFDNAHNIARETAAGIATVRQQSIGGIHK